MWIWLWGTYIESQSPEVGSTPTSLPPKTPNNYPQPHLFGSRSLKKGFESHTKL